ncbi:helix-turn-helix domain-containing protein [Dietzia sp. Die43]|uniref:helix-turn-helix domain-containing protein n=1 Tax=Dietzia sp. Die43 TaxID=2926011 RepID=UPI00211767C3|nr:helix-turn-helix transcriptional regulator [Dietzia sp. Die43]
MRNTEDDGRDTRGSAEAREWAARQVALVGENVARLRHSLGLSAVQLATRTAEHGYPITRGTIAKLEGGHRGGKLDMAEVQVLAAALEVPPVELLFAGLPDESTEVLPEVWVPAWEAMRWFTGEARGANNPVPTRTDLIEAVRQRVDLRYLVDEISMQVLAAGLTPHGPLDKAELERQLGRARERLAAAELKVAELRAGRA